MPCSRRSRLRKRSWLGDRSCTDNKARTAGLHRARVPAWIPADPTRSTESHSVG